MTSEAIPTLTLGEICAQQQGGLIQTGPFGGQLHASDYSAEGVPVIMPADIVGGTVSLSKIARVHPAHVERLAQHKVLLSDIVFSRRGDVTRYAYIREREVGWLCGTGCIKVRIGHGNKALPEYVAYALSTSEVKEWLIRHAVGATMLNLNAAILSDLPIILPPLAHQREIASLLRTLDDRFQVCVTAINILESMTQTIFRSWFIDFDVVQAKADSREPTLIDAATANLFPRVLVETQLGWIPEGWRVAKYADLLDPTAERVGAQHFPEYSATVDGILPRDGRFTKQLSRSRSANKLVRKNDLVFGLSRGVLNFGVMVDPIGSVSPVYEVFRVDAEQFIPQILEFYIRHHMRAHMDILKPGAREGQPIDRNYLLSKSVLIPDMRVQRAFCDLVLGPESIGALVQSNRQRAATLADLRDTLLPRLISGQLRIPEAQEAVEEALTV